MYVNIYAFTYFLLNTYLPKPITILDLERSEQCIGFTDYNNNIVSVYF